MILIGFAEGYEHDIVLRDRQGQGLAVRQIIENQIDIAVFQQAFKRRIGRKIAGHHQHQHAQFDRLLRCGDVVNAL